MTHLFFGGWGWVRLSFAVTLFWMWYKKCTHRNTPLCITPYLHVWHAHNQVRKVSRTKCVPTMFLSKQTLYTEEPTNVQQQNISNFIRMIMAHGWLAPLASVSTFSWKSGTRWWNVCHPWSILCAQKTAYSYILKYWEQRKWGGGGRS